MSQSVNNNEVIFYSTFFYFPFEIDERVRIKDILPLKVKGFGKWKDVDFELWHGNENNWEEVSLNNQEVTVSAMTANNLYVLMR